MSKCKELVWPGLMLTASCVNLCGAAVAIMVGADETPDGKVNPFFYTAMTTSFLYALANGTKVYEVCTKPRTFVQMVEESVNDVVIDIQR